MKFRTRMWQFASDFSEQHSVTGEIAFLTKTSKLKSKNILANPISLSTIYSYKLNNVYVNEYILYKFKEQKL